MPLYEYKCKSCGKRFEVLQKFSDEPIAVHEECGGPVEKLLSSPAFHFKGTGWYVTDYAKSNGTSPSPESKSDKTDSAAGKSETKSESKPAESKPAESKPATTAPTTDTK